MVPSEDRLQGLADCYGLDSHADLVFTDHGATFVAK